MTWKNRVYLVLQHSIEGVIKWNAQQFQCNSLTMLTYICLQPLTTDSSEFYI